MFSSDDLAQLEARGISPEQAARQVEHMFRGFARVRLDRPCTVGDGLLRVSAEEQTECSDAFARAAGAGRISKFVPASGAATRMFQALLSVYGSGLSLDSDGLRRLGTEGPERGALLEANGVGFVDAELAVRFLRAIEEFPFAPELAVAAGADGVLGLGETVRDGGGRRILEALLREPGLGFASLPKGLIPFHHYSDGPWTPLAEHVAEGWELLVARGSGHPIRVHFTIPPGWESAIRERLDSVTRSFPEARFEIGLSVQSPATDTIAGNPEGGPFRAEDGRLVFRPGGHGALLTNLGNLCGDIVLLKNVDNIARRSWRQRQHESRRLLAGLVVRLEEQVGQWRAELSTIAPAASEGSCPAANEASRSAANEGSRSDFAHGAARLVRLEAAYTRVFSRILPPPSGRDGFTGRVERFRELLDRPIRVCGMVANEGEPGGGPFWVQHPDGTLDIQIVELSQIDRSDPHQVRAIDVATHFNPVDLAVSLRDAEGRSYDLRSFVDEETGIVAEKSDGGRPLRALELPGLWNGSMAAWNTVFVEIPIETFTPVKTVLDLLRDPHRAEG